MKKLFFFFFFTGPLLCASQTEKGNFLLGGSASYSTTKTGGGSTQLTGTYTHTNMDFSPNAGYFFLNRLAAGLIASIGQEKYSNNAFPSTETRQYTDVGLSARYYFILGEKWAIFPRMEALYGSFSNHSASLNSTGNETIWKVVQVSPISSRSQSAQKDLRLIKP